MMQLHASCGAKVQYLTFLKHSLGAELALFLPVWQSSLVRRQRQDSHPAGLERCVPPQHAFEYL